MTTAASVSTPASGAAAMRALIVAALAAGWTVPSSSDGTTYNSSGNQITADSGANSLANAGAWVRLRQPGGGRELVFQRGSDNTQWRALYSKAGFSGGSPGATRVPTATEQQLLIGGGSDASPSYATLFDTDGNYRWLVSLDDASPYTFWAVALTVGSLAATTAIALLGLETGSYDTSDTDPYVVLATGSSVLVHDTLWQGHNTAYRNFHAFYRYATTQAWYAVGFASPWIGQGNIGAESTTVGSNILSSVAGQEVPLDIIAGFRSTVSAWKGRVKGAKYVGANTTTAPNGTHLTDGAGTYWVRAGALWIPWTSSVPSL